MPALLMRSREGTLLAQTCELVVEAQIAYGKKTNAPWGISESAYARLDAHQTYQYQSFGVPGLGFKRGLEDDLVVAPYASLLAAVDSARARCSTTSSGSRRWGCSGPTACSRPSTCAPSARLGRAPVHGGALVHGAPPGDAPRRARQPPERPDHGRAVPRRPAGRDGRAPAQRARARDRAARVAASRARRERRRRGRRRTSRALRPPWSPDAQGRPQAFVLEQRPPLELADRLRGRRPPLAGPRDHALPARRRRRRRRHSGSTCATRRAGDSGSRPPSEGRTTFAAHKAEFHQRDEGISVHVDVAVAPADDVEVRQITLHNETDRRGTSR